MSELLGAWGMSGFEAFLQRQQALYARRAALASAAAARHLSGLAEWRAPVSGMFMWLKLTGEAGAELNVGHVCFCAFLLIWWGEAALEVGLLFWDSFRTAGQPPVQHQVARPQMPAMPYGQEGSGRCAACDNMCQACMHTCCTAWL